MMIIIIALVLVPMLLRKQITSFLKQPEFTDDKLFENFVCEDFFVREKYEYIDLLDIIVLADAVLTDLKFKQINSGYEFFIKPMYCSKADRNELKLCTDQEFLFLSNEIEIPIYIMLGVGGPAHFPDSLYLIPFKDLTSNKLNISSLQQYLVSYKDRDIDFTSY